METYTIKIQKTIQEQAYEPFVIGLEHTFNIPDNQTFKQRDLLINKQYELLEDKLEELLVNRVGEEDD